MSRRAPPAQRSPSPAAVTVTCDNCGGQFTTSESTAFNASQRNEDLLCKPCENGQPAPPSKALEEPEIDAIREDLQYRDGVGPDAEPPVEATLPEFSSDLASQSEVEVELTKGTESLGTVTVAIGDLDEGGPYLSASIEPSADIYTDEVTDEIMSALSLGTQLLLTFDSTEGNR